MKKLLLLLCVLLIFTLCACTPNSSAEQTQGNAGLLIGEVSDGTYTNDVVGFSAAIPEGWSVANPQQMSHVFGVSAEILQSATSLDPGKQLVIFYCSKYDLGYVGANSGVGIQISNEDEMKALLTSEQALNDYVEQNRTSLEQQYGDANATLTSERNVKVRDNEYSVIHISANFKGTQIIQDMYITGINGYVVMITESYSDDTDKAIADKFIESLKVK